MEAELGLVLLVVMSAREPGCAFVVRATNNFGAVVGVTVFYSCRPVIVERVFKAAADHWSKATLIALEPFEEVAGARSGGPVATILDVRIRHAGFAISQ